MRASRFLADTIGGWPLPADLAVGEPVSGAAYAAQQWWTRRYLQPKSAKVEFVMLNRLAELLVRAVPKLRRALRQTYPFVFIDEFQDTTRAQFSLLTSVFAAGPTVTAVGDTNQNIMTWAGAVPQALDQFTAAFNAHPYHLDLNFRSSPELVQVQHIVATRLDPTARLAVSQSESGVDGSPAQVWRFPNPAREAAVIADWIAQDIAASGRVPGDFALLARQKIDGYETLLGQALAGRGIAVRNDDQVVGKMRLQDLLKHDITRLLLGLLRLAEHPRGLHRIWHEVQAILGRVHNATGDDSAQRRVGDNLSEMAISLRSWLQTNPPALTSASDCVAYLLDLLDTGVLRRYVRTATPGDELTLITDAFQARLASATADSLTWATALERFESADAVTLLTAHRSKGLEYHTVFFLGLDDRQWWSHARDPLESTATFFVGLSRAAHRIIFTTTSAYARQGNIAVFFTMLDEAGVPEIDHG